MQVRIHRGFAGIAVALPLSLVLIGCGGAEPRPAPRPPAITPAQDLVTVRTYKSSDGRNRINVFPVTNASLDDPSALFENRQEHELSADFAYRFWSVGATC